MNIKNIGAWLLGHILKLKLNLKGGQMGNTKKWWQSKTIWCAIVTFVIGLYNLVDVNIAPVFQFDLPEIPSWIYTILGVLIGYSRVVAKKDIV